MRTRLLLPAVVLAGIVFSGCTVPASAGSSEVKVNIRHSKFSLEKFSFGVGQQVTFIIQNNDPIDHEFILGDEEVQDRHELGTEPHHAAIPTEVSLPAKGEIQTTITFDKAGTFIIGCHLPGHYAYGMKAEVRVSA